MSGRIGWWQPEIGEQERERVIEVLRSNYINDGDVTEQFAGTIAKLTGAKFGVGVTSGTSAIYLSLVALGIGHGDEVIVPDITFIATANAVSMTGATPVLADVDPETLNLSVNAMETAITSRTKAVVPVHVSGRAAAIDKIIDVAGQRGLSVIEDAAEGFCSRFNKRCLGTFGQTGCFSFSPNKIITTGQGGVIVTNDETIFHRLRELKDQGRPVRGTGGADVHDSVGFNFKLTNLQAAVGLGQLKKLNERMERIRQTYSVYRDGLAQTKGIRILPFNIEAGEQPQWVDALAERRDELDEFLDKNGAGCRRFWFPLHTQKPYRRDEKDFPNSTRVGKQAIWLPSAFQMTDDDVRSVCRLITKFYNQ
ncbi:MAG: DegT/DnrJ/EryC1/StrS family aminotransferase [Verrucomicrobia bacterium]|nr:DegT/DnrJ/EryC1/StrS family aminotransferase [Verrucomicrobiota bacterium]